MIVNDKFVLQDVMDEYIVVPIGEAAEKLHGIIKLNETGALLWKAMADHNCTEEELVDMIVTEYHIDVEKARADVVQYAKALYEQGCIDL